MTRRPDYGDRARLGVITPSGNTVAEPEIHAMTERLLDLAA